MEKLATGLSRKAGLIPGTLVHVGDLDQHPVRITLINYDADHVTERELTAADECPECKDDKTVTWINIEGVHDAGVVERVGAAFGLHPLVMEDVMNTEQRPKIEDYDDYLYIVVRMLYERPGDDEDSLEIDSEQVSFIVGPNVLITFLEDPGDVFDPVRKRIRESRGRVRKYGTDYLAYALIDVIVDNYFTVLERFGDLTEDLEQEVMGDPTIETLHAIQQMKRAMIQVRRAIWPLRDVVSVLVRGDSSLIKKATLVFLRDIYDHVVRVVDVVETQREMLGGLMEIYLSTVSNRMNQVMKVLTVIATVFIPLTFIVGVYGMNFVNMPELHWRYGYWFTWGVMVVVVGVMVMYFRRKKWF